MSVNYAHAISRNADIAKLKYFDSNDWLYSFVFVRLIPKNDAHFIGGSLYRETNINIFKGESNWHEPVELTSINI